MLSILVSLPLISQSSLMKEKEEKKMKEGDIGTGNVAVTIANCQQEKELITNL